MSDYKIEIEIYEGKGGHLRKDGDTIIAPDVVKEGICAWMYRGDGHSLQLSRYALLCLSSCLIQPTMYRTRPQIA
jgi:hypothetical protein